MFSNFSTNNQTGIEIKNLFKNYLFKRKNGTLPFVLMFHIMFHRTCIITTFIKSVMFKKM